MKFWLSVVMTLATMAVLMVIVWVDKPNDHIIPTVLVTEVSLPKMPEPPTIPPIPKPPKKIALNHEYKLLVATVYGEAEGTSLEAKKAVASTIINRTALKWDGYSSMSKVIRHTGYDAAKFKNDGFKRAMGCLQFANHKCNKEIKELIDILKPVYYDKRVTTKAVFYYSPKAQARFHKKNPRMYKAVPAWTKSKTLQVVRKDIKDDLRFYAVRKK